MTKKYDDEDRVYTPREAMIVGTSLTEMKRDTLSMIPSRAHPKLRMSAGKSSPGQDCWRICNCDSYSIGRMEGKTFSSESFREPFKNSLADFFCQGGTPPPLYGTCYTPLTENNLGKKILAKHYKKLFLLK